jgi:hypothetical protein
MAARFLKRFLHPVGLAGLGIFAVGFAAGAFALLADVFDVSRRPYQGLLTFVVYPTVMLIGLSIAAVGLALDRRRSRRLGSSPEEWRPALDLGLRRHRWIVFALVSFVLLFAGLSVIGAFRAFQFTESEEFCGALCHQPMEPQYTAHQDCIHADVSCVRCHVEPKLGGYLSAKLSGLEQLQAYLADSYSRPIVASPARSQTTAQACDSCHWRGRHAKRKLVERTRYGLDLRNTRREIKVLLELGGSGGGGEPAHGIHWHASRDHSVWYRPSDDTLAKIPWVKVVRADGSTSVYVDRAVEVREEEISGIEERRMGCLDCHSRPAHRFSTAEDAVDAAMESGRIDATLPSIKQVAVEALNRNWEEKPAALEGIPRSIQEYYREHFGGAVLERKAALAASAEALDQIYRRHFFPEVRVDGFTYPDRNGHRVWSGCLRCHSGTHFSDDGRVLGSSCILCHSFYERSPASGDLVEIPVDGSTLHPFRHREQGDLKCWDCHGERTGPYSACARCHEEACGPGGMRFACSTCHRPGKVSVESRSCGPCHPTAASALHGHPEHADCLKCHGAHSWKVSYPQACSPCHERAGESPLSAHYPGQPCSPCHDFRGVESHFLGLRASSR